MSEVPMIRRGRYLSIVTDVREISVTYRLSVELTFRQPSLEREVKRKVRSLYRRANPINETSDGVNLVAIFPFDAFDEVKALEVRIDRELKKLSVKPLPSKMVEIILNISGAERLRWSKDGRLAQSGTGTFKKAHIVQYSLYSPTTVARLLAEPEIIAGWRQSDIEGK